MALTSDDIGLEQHKLIENVQDLTAVESHVARQLLQEMKWNYESVAELYYEDTEKLLSKAGISVNEALMGNDGKAISGLHLDESGCFTCQVCYDTFEGEAEMVSNVREFPSCGHAMCKSCWFQQLKTKVIDEGVSVRIACPGFSMVDGKVKRCNIILDERFVLKLLKEVEAEGEEPEAERTRKRYQKQLNDNYVNNNHCIKWCPVRLLVWSFLLAFSVACLFVAKFLLPFACPAFISYTMMSVRGGSILQAAGEGEVSDVMCGCYMLLQSTDCTSAVRIKDSFDKNSFCTDVVCAERHPWCFSCMDEPHAPADCKQVKDWRKKCAVRISAAPHR